MVDDEMVDLISTYHLYNDQINIICLTIYHLISSHDSNVPSHLSHLFPSVTEIIESEDIKV